MKVNFRLGRMIAKPCPTVIGSRPLRDHDASCRWLAVTVVRVGWRSSAGFSGLWLPLRHQPTDIIELAWQTLKTWLNHLSFNTFSSEQGLSKKRKKSPYSKLESESKDTEKRVRFAQINVCSSFPLFLRWFHWTALGVLSAYNFSFQLVRESACT